MLALVLVGSSLACAKSEDRITTLEGRIAELERKATAHEENTSAIAKGLTDTIAKQDDTRRAAEAATNDRITAVEVDVADLQNQLAAIAAKTGTGGASSEAIVKSGVKACDDYLEKYTKCITAKVPAAARESMMDALAQSSRAWKEAAEGPAREGLETACKAALDAAKQATEPMGCEW